MYDTLFAQQAQFFKALSHPRRLEIVTLLGHGPLSVTDIFSMLALPQANVSQHLLILKQAHVLTATKHGKEIIYQLKSKDVASVCQQVAELSGAGQGDLSDWRRMLPVVIDPVCGMRVSPRTAGAMTSQGGHDYYFCASGCKQKFLENPAAYTGDII